MLAYRELAPPAHLADAVECIWVSRQLSCAAATHRVVPDGCADIVFTRAGCYSDLRFVGPMTRFQEFALEPGSFVVGVRFRPGMWSDLFRLDGSGLADLVAPLRDVLGARATVLWSKLEAIDEPASAARLLAQSLPAAKARSPVQNAIAAMEQSHGNLSVDLAASGAGLSVRHFRRLCVKQTSLTPKLLARILRFRHAASFASEMAGQHADLAAACGYADQSHWIAEHRRFTGRAPSHSI